MTPKPLMSFVAALSVLYAAAAPAQIPINTAQPAGPGVQARADVRVSLIRSMCKHSPPPAVPVNANAQRPPVPLGPFPYEVTAIPGVIAAGQHWTMIWAENGNNADGIIGQPDGSVLVAQNDNSDVLKIEPNGHSTVVYQDTDTGGEVTETKGGQLFVTERALISSVWELAPERKMLADSYLGEPLDCRGGILDSARALNNGGVYFGDNGLYYANPEGVVTQYSQDLQPNDLALSADEKTLYAFSHGKIYTFDIAPDGALSNQRLFATIPGGGNDGGTIDAAGNVYVGGVPGVRVFDRDGKYLGIIPAPYDSTDQAFSGPDKKTLFITGHINRPGGFVSIVMSIPMIAQGYLDRPK